MYERLIFDYKNSDNPAINHATDILTRVIHLNVKIIMSKSKQKNSKYFPQLFSDKTVCNRKDPQWFNNANRKILSKENEIIAQHIAYVKSKANYESLQVIRNSLIETIRASKENFYCQLSTQLANPS